MTSGHSCEQGAAAASRSRKAQQGGRPRERETPQHSARAREFARYTRDDPAKAHPDAKGQPQATIRLEVTAAMPCLMPPEQAPRAAQRRHG